VVSAFFGGLRRFGSVFFLFLSALELQPVDARDNTADALITSSWCSALFPFVYWCVPSFVF